MTPEPGPKKRLPHVDLLKSLAIWFVLLYHGSIYPVYLNLNSPPSMLARYFFQSILSTCVPLFFFVSGYLMLSRPFNLKKHSIRTGKMMLLTCFWILFLLVILSYFYQEPIDWQNLKEGIWNLRAGRNNHLWYMGVLIGLYLMFPLLKAAYDHSRSGFFWFTAVMAVLVFGYSFLNQIVTVLNLFIRKEFYLYESNFPLFSQFNPFLYDNRMGVAYFCLGGAAHALEQRLLNIPARWRNLASVTGLVICCGLLSILGWRFSLYLDSVWDLVWNGYTTVFTAGNVLFLYLLSLNLKKDSGFLRCLSANTLSIYLIHDLIQKLVLPYVTQIPAVYTLPGTIVYATGLLLLTLGICLILKKIPLVKHLIS